jgi:hypothetical protein
LAPVISYYRSKRLIITITYLTYPYPIKPTNLPPNPKNKKEQVWELVSDGKYTTGQITSIVHTTKDYVWKKTSRLKSKTVGSLLVNRSTTELSKTRDETSTIFQLTFYGEQNQGIFQYQIANLEHQ